MLMPEFSNDKDIEHFIADMSTYLGQISSYKKPS
jgi:hypothetical protein